MTKQNELRVFISSTFRDLGEEREHLIKKIFPEIRALCRSRGVTFTEVDLRWGLTDEEATLGHVIRTCLEEIDKCRPYFIGIIGDRYGWVPEYHEIMMDPDLLDRFPWTEELATDGTSVTEMEFVHGVFEAPDQEGTCAYFYRRKGDIDISGVDNPERLRALVERAKETGRPFREFGDLDAFGNAVRDDLREMIDKYWPADASPSELDLERRAHTAFAASRRRAYIPNLDYLKAFASWLADGDQPLVISGESGHGKSALMAFLEENHRKKNPTDFVVAHYVGASPNSGTSSAAMRHIVAEICERFSIDEEVPADPDILRASFPNWLFRCEQMAATEGIHVLIMVDAVNQLDRKGRALSWLPSTIPPGLKFVVSTTPGECNDALSGRHWNQIPVQPIHDERVRQGIIVRYLGEFRKRISRDLVERLAADDKGDSPLFLRVVAEELRLHGEHETVNEIVDHYIGATDLLEVFEQVLERMEQDYGEKSVRHLMSLIAISESGLSETELLELTGITRLLLSQMMFAFDYHLIRRDGILGFFHTYLQQAVEQRYLADESERRSLRRELADDLQTIVWESGSEDIHPRHARELCAQLASLQEWEELGRNLAHIPLFMSLYQDESKYTLLSYWKQIEDHLEESTGINVELAYQQGIENWKRANYSKRCRALQGIGQMFDNMGRFNAAMTVQQKSLSIAREQNLRREEANGLEGIGSTFQHMGESKDAATAFQEAIDILRELGDEAGVIQVSGNLGVAQFRLGEYGIAKKLFRECEAYYRKVGLEGKLAGTLNNIATLPNSGSEETGDENLMLLYQALQINRRMGNKAWELRNLGNIGNELLRQGELERGIESIEQSIAISEELGDRANKIHSLGLLGLIRFRCGQFSTALEYTEELFAENEALGDQHNIGMTLGVASQIHRAMHNYEKAYEQISRAIETHRGIDYLRGLTYWLEEYCVLLLDIVDESTAPPAYLTSDPAMTFGNGVEADWKSVIYARVREVAEECIRISSKLEKEDTLVRAHYVIARVTARQGDAEQARNRLKELLGETKMSALIADGHYWLWRMDDPNPHHREEAIRLYRIANQKLPNFLQQQRIEEMEGVEKG
ncbi:MAG: tetratricopeptide repeat protein [Candidatus Kapaibacterium sp.]